ncbi:MAG: hypothetical protein J6J11_08125 [Treponema sp.]|nr:hypothetical protein [Treponema sp.]
MATGSRKFSLISYLNEEQIQKCLLSHGCQIRCYEYIYHDKDVFDEIDEKKNSEHKAGTPKEPHYHILIVTFNQCTVSAVRKWFKGYVDSNGEITTTAQVMCDVYSMDEYITHDDKESIARGKFRYPRSAVKCSDINYFQAKLESEYDNSTLIVEMLLRGVSIRQIVKMFGKDFIYHYSQIKQVVNDIQVCEKHNINDIGHLIGFQEQGYSALWDLEDFK